MNKFTITNPSTIKYSKKMGNLYFLTSFLIVLIVFFNKNMYDYLKIVRHLGGGSEAIVWHLGGYCLARCLTRWGRGPK